MNDFETVRKDLPKHLGPPSPGYAALDRIEAEIKRLQAIIQANDNYDQDATEREVERLKALAKSYRRDWVTAEAENKRLRTDFKRAQTEMLRLEDEVERLQAENRQLRRRV
jgi:predicted RNase H-like nuclease (RuvC/YqgF family)